MSQAQPDAAVQHENRNNSSEPGVRPSGRVGKPENLRKGGGRPKGVPNGITRTAREQFAALVDRHSSKLDEWLVAIEEQHGPLVAFRCLMDVAEYHVPKLQRTEVTGVNISIHGLHIDALRALNAPRSQALVERVHELQEHALQSLQHPAPAPALANNVTGNRNDEG